MDVFFSILIKVQVVKGKQIKYRKIKFPYCLHLKNVLKGTFDNVHI